MDSVTAWIVGPVLALLLVACGLLLVKRALGESRRPRMSEAAERRKRSTSGSPIGSPGQRIGANLTPIPTPVDQVSWIETGNPGELLLLGSEDLLPEAGRRVPAQLARAAVIGSDATTAISEAVKLSGRLVLVDGQTAAGIKAGTMMLDKSGEMIAATLKGGHTVEHLARLKPIGAAGGMVTAGPAVLSAIAMQAQMANIEKRLEEVADGVSDLIHRDDLRLTSTIKAQSQALSQARRVSERVGELTEGTWSEIQGMRANVIQSHLEAKGHLAGALEKLGALREKSIKVRENRINAAVSELEKAFLTVELSTRNYVTYVGLHAWRLAITNDPAAEQYLDEARAFLSTQNELVELQENALQIVRELDRAGRVDRRLHWHRHPQLVDRTQKQLVHVKSWPWEAITLTRQADHPDETPDPKMIEPPLDQGQAL